MPLYMGQGSYTSDAWAALVKKPQNREDVLRGLIEKLGGRLVSFYYAFGKHDVIFIAEMPDETAISAVVLSTIAAGHLKGIETTTLLTTQQTMEAMRKAGSQTYQAPG